MQLTSMWMWGCLVYRVAEDIVEEAQEATERLAWSVEHMFGRLSLASDGTGVTQAILQAGSEIP
jgi:hypothetical protein